MKLHGIEDIMCLLDKEALGDIVFKMQAVINDEEYTLTTPKAIRLNSKSIRQAKKYSKKKKEKCLNEERRKNDNQP